MSDLITEARELYKKWVCSEADVYECETCISIEIAEKLRALCDALEKAEERGQGCEHCQGWDTRSGAQYCPMCGKKLPVYAGTIGGEIVQHALKELGAEEGKEE